MKYEPKPWYFKAGRLNMISGEPVGCYFRCPVFEVIACVYDWNDVTFSVQRP